jgi:hypothetical protein
LVHTVEIIFKGKGFYVTDNSSAASSHRVQKARGQSKVPETGDGARAYNDRDSTPVESVKKTQESSSKETM